MYIARIRFLQLPPITLCTLASVCVCVCVCVCARACVRACAVFHHAMLFPFSSIGSFFSRRLLLPLLVFLVILVFSLSDVFRLHVSCTCWGWLKLSLSLSVMCARARSFSLRSLYYFFVCLFSFRHHLSLFLFIQSLYLLLKAQIAVQCHMQEVG